MAAILLPDRFRQQPQGLVDIDRNNELARSSYSSFLALTQRRVWALPHTQQYSYQNYWEPGTFSVDGFGALTGLGFPGAGSIADQTFQRSSYDGSTPVGILVVADKPTSTGTLSRIISAGTTTILLGYDGTNGWYVQAQTGIAAQANSTDLRQSGVFFAVLDPVAGTTTLWASGRIIASASGAAGTLNTSTRFQRCAAERSKIVVCESFAGSEITTDSFAKEISANPWQIFKPLRSRMYFLAAAGGGADAAVTSDGTGAATASGASEATATASADGTGAATGAGAATASSAAISDGQATATAAGDELWSATATAAGTGDAQGVAAAIVSAAASSDGAATASAVGFEVQPAAEAGAASSTGAATAEAAGASTAAAAGDAAGTGDAQATTASVAAASASADGTGTATAGGAAIDASVTETAASSAGTGTAEAATASIAAAAASAAGDSTARAVGAGGAALAQPDTGGLIRTRLLHRKRIEDQIRRDEQEAAEAFRLAAPIITGSRTPAADIRVSIH